MMVTGWQWQKMSKQEKLLAQQTANYQQEQAAQRKQQEVQQQQLTMMNDSMGMLQASNREMKAQQELEAQQRKRVKDAISKGYAIINKAQKECGLSQHLDTLSDIRYLCTDYAQRASAGYQAANAYWTSIAKDFNDSEMTEIKNALTQHSSEQIEKWNKKMMKIKDQYDATITE